MLDERSVGVEAIALGDVREDRRQGVAGERELGGGAADGPAHGDRTAQVDAVGAGGGAGVVAERGVGDEVVDGGAGGLDPALVQMLVERVDQVGQQPGAADLPLPPVAVARGGRVVDLRRQVVETGDDVTEEPGVAGEAGGGLEEGLGHGPQPAVAPGDPGGRVERAVRPERVVGRGHRGPEGPGAVAGLLEPGGVRLGARVVAGAEREVAPAPAQYGELVGGGGLGSHGQGESACPHHGEERATGPRGQQGHGELPEGSGVDRCRWCSTACPGRSMPRTHRRESAC